MSYLAVSIRLFLYFKHRNWKKFITYTHDIFVKIAYLIVFSSVVGLLLNLWLNFDGHKTVIYTTFTAVPVLIFIVVGAYGLREFSYNKSLSNIFNNIILMIQTSFAMTKLGAIGLLITGYLILALAYLGPGLGYVIFLLYKKSKPNSRLRLKNMQDFISFAIIYPLFGIWLSFALINPNFNFAY